jgi:hypothetical protein
MKLMVQRTATALRPTSDDVVRDDARPYFLWWTDLTVAELRRQLRHEDLAVRAYWMGALMREANTRDVWQFVRPRQIRELWPHLLRHLGRTRSRWAWLLQLPDAPWPPPVEE